MRSPWSDDKSEERFFHPPEAVNLETRNVSLREKNAGASDVFIASNVTNDIWVDGVVLYEAICGLPLSPYRSLHKAKRALTTAELFKVGQWDDRSLRKALRHIDNNENARDLMKLVRTLEMKNYGNEKRIAHISF